MRELIVSTAALAVIAALAVPARAVTRSVKVDDNYYVRAGGVPAVTVKRNDTVSWNFVGRSAHTVTVARGPAKFRSRPMTSQSYRKTMTKAGTYRIFCSIHGPRDMSMVLKVK
jgi:plastocyanin